MITRKSILLFFIILVQLSFAEDIDTGVDLKKELRQAYDTIRQIKKSGGFELVAIPEEDKPNKGFCVSCDSLSPLVTEVNKIILKVAEAEEEKDPDKRLLETVSGLDALYHYTYSEEFMSDDISCVRFDDSGTNQNNKDIDLSQTTILVSSEIPVEKINALQVKDEEKRTYFYRGKNDDNNIIIRIDVHDQEKAKVTYYKMKESLLADLNKPEKEKGKKKDKKWELWASSTDPEESNQKGEDRVDYGAGISIEHSNNIPKKLTLIKGSSYTTVADIFAIKTSSEISTKKQRVSMSISSTEGDDFAKVDIDKDFAELEIPMELDILDSGLKVNTRYSVNTKNEQKVYLTLDGEQGSSTSLILQRDAKGNSASFNRTQNLSKSQKVSLQVKSEQIGQSEAWLRYELAF